MPAQLIFSQYYEDVVVFCLCGTVTSVVSTALLIFPHTLLYMRQWVDMLYLCGNWSFYLTYLCQLETTTFNGEVRTEVSVQGKGKANVIHIFSA